MDRDYMRERPEHRDAPFRPAESNVGSLLWPLVFWVAIFFVLFQAFRWYEQHGADLSLRHGHRVQANSAKEPGPAPARPVNIPQRQTPELPQAPAYSTISKCVRDGTVSFSDAGCGAGSRQETVVQMPNVDRQTEASTTQIYLCKAYDGGMFWASTHCGQHRALIERIAPVPPGLPFDQQVAIATQQQRAAQQVVAATMPPPVQQVQPVSNLRAQCAAFEKEIEAIDARARQPLTAGEQDWLAEKRRNARDAQFRMRC